MTRQSNPGDNEFSEIVAIPEIKVVHYDHADLDSNNTLSIPVDADTIVLAVGHETEAEAFSGGSPAITIGDGTTADLFAAAADSMPLTAGSFKMPFKGGKRYASAGAIVLTHAAGLTAGKGALHILSFTRKGNWRQPDL